MKFSGNVNHLFGFTIGAKIIKVTLWGSLAETLSLSLDQHDLWPFVVITTPTIARRFLGR